MTARISPSRSRLWLKVLAAGALLFGACKDGMFLDQRKSTSTPSSAPAPSPAPSTLRDITYTVTITITPDGSAPAPAPSTPVLVGDVQPLFNAHCVQCHTPGQTLDLTKSPYTCSDFSTQAALLTEILKRVQSQDPSVAMPPPPATALAASDIATLTAWQSDGLLTAAPPTSPVATASYAQGLVVDLKIRPLGAADWTETTMPWNGTGVFTGAVAQQAVGSQLEAVLTLKGEDGQTITSSPFGSLDVGMSNSLAFPLTVADGQVRAHAIDHTAPTPGSGGAVTVTAVDEQSFTITFAPAQDALTDASALAYAVFVSSSNNVTTLADAQANGRKVQDFGPYPASVKIDSLTIATTYYVAVLVRNRSGKIALYAPLSQMTVDNVPPVVDTPALTVTALTDSSCTLSWTRSHDNITAQPQLTYQVYSSLNDNLDTAAAALANGLPAGPSATDQVTVNLGGMTPATTYYLTVLVADAAGNHSAYQRTKVQTAAAGTSTLTQADYAKECATRLGSLPPFSCLDGQIGPITVDGQTIAPGLTAAQAAAYHFSTLGANQQTCDRPQLLGLGAEGHCMPYARFGRLQAVDKSGNPRQDVDTMFGCRRYTARVGPVTWQGQTYDGAVYPGFEDIAIIQHNRVTGETCFFQMLRGDFSSVDGRRVPPPDEVSLPSGAPVYALPASQFWLDPVNAASKGCNKCHDSDPWVHSPYIDQIRQADGTPLVPPGGKGQPYSIVGSRGFSDWQRSVAIASTVTADTNGKSCTSCHDIGSLNTCAAFARQSAGQVQAPNLSTTGATWPLDHWMPLPQDPTVKALADWQAAGYQKAADHLFTCCDTPAADGCATTPIMTAPPPYVVQ